MQLETIPKRKNRKMPDKRLGRGYGSGVGGHTVGRGQKGQKSRSGHKSTVFFEGGNRPFFSRVPKYRGFNRTMKIAFEPVNVTVLENEFKAGEVVSLDSLKEKGLIRKTSKQAKILGYGDLTKKLSIENLAVSASAKEKIEKAGGSIK